MRRIGAAVLLRSPSSAMELSRSLHTVHRCHLLRSADLAPAATTLLLWPLQGVNTLFFSLQALFSHTSF